MARRGKRVLFLVHRDDLIRDVMARALAVEPNLPAGKVQGKHNEIDAQCVFASVASLGPKRLPQLGAFDCILTDEAHHATAPSYQRVYARVRDQNPSVLHIGLTATPFRSAPKGETSGLGRVFEALVYEYPLDVAIADGALVPVNGLKVQTQMVVTGDLDDDEAVGKQVDTEDRNNLVVDQYLKAAAGKPAVVFCATVAHAKHVAEAFRARGVRAESVWGEMPDRDREATLALYRQRPDLLPVLCNKDLLTEGFDAPKTEVVMLARPTQSRGLYAQMVGRCTRLSFATGKTEGLVIDLVDNCGTHKLASFADLTSPPDEQTVTLRFGEKVRHKTDKDLTLGVVLDVDREGPVPKVEVDWKVKVAGVRWHPTREILRIVPLKKADEPEQLRIGGIAGVSEFKVVLFGGAATRSAVGWYETVSTKGTRRLTASGGDRPQLVVQLLQQKAPKGTKEETWEAWALLDDRAWHLTTGDLDAVQDAGVEAFRAERIPPRQFGANWQKDGASDAQKAALRKWKVADKKLETISKGEASILMTAHIARVRIDDARKAA